MFQSGRSKPILRQLSSNSLHLYHTFFDDPSGRAVRGVGLDRLDTETVGSNPAQGTNVCPSLIVINIIIIIAIFIIHVSPYYRLTRDNILSNAAYSRCIIRMETFK
jgi:hypothetical protein